MGNFAGSFGIGLGLFLLQGLAALPWVVAIDPPAVVGWLRKPKNGLVVAGIVVGALVLLRFFSFLFWYGSLEAWGRVYGSVLQLQLIADFFLLVFALLLTFWPRGGAVALAAFREGVRQPIFWLLLAGTVVLMAVSLVLPYFTFGDDYKMMKQLGFDMVMLVTAFFVVLTACLSIGEEIEGRTAVTLMSKPLSRRQFLFGKFLGILLSGLAMTALLGWALNWALWVKPMIESPLDDSTDLLQVQIQPGLNAVVEAVTGDEAVQSLLQGFALWSGGALATLPGLTIGFCQAMVLLAIAAALATRLPLVVNLVFCGFTFLMGNLAPHLLRVAAGLQQRSKADNQTVASGAYELVQFVARLFDTVLPALNYFSLGPAIVRDQPLPLVPYLQYVTSVVGYSLLYTAIALFVGLILFEDRDLA